MFQKVGIHLKQSFSPLFGKLHGYKKKTCWQKNKKAFLSGSIRPQTMKTPQKGPKLAGCFEPRTFLLCANNCTTVLLLPGTIICSSH